MITTKRVDKSALPDNYLSAEYLSQVKGRYTNIGFTSGSVLTTGNVATKDSKKSAVIPDGYTLLSINVQSLPQGVQPDDHVNILVGISVNGQGKVVVTYQNVLVTGTYSDSDGSVTGLEVQVTPEQAQKIQYAQSNGSLSVSLLPLGYSEQQLDVVDENSIKDFAISSSTDTSSSRKTSDDDEDYTVDEDDYSDYEEVDSED